MTVPAPSEEERDRVVTHRPSELKRADTPEKEVPREAAEAERPPQEDGEGYLLHIVKRGDTMSGLAKRYYGDPGKSHVIAACNTIRNRDRIRVGQVIRIPRGGGDAPDGGPGNGPLEADRDSERDEAAFHRNRGIDFFEMGDFEAALAEFDRALSLDPGDGVSAEFAGECHMRKGRASFDEKDYMAARGHFQACLQYRESCGECVEKARMSETVYKEIHYRRGMQLFGEERLAEAVESWERVRAVDPHYKGVEHLIVKGRTMLRKIDTIRKKGT